MSHKGHKHKIKQILLATITLLIFSCVLFVLVYPNINSIAMVDKNKKDPEQKVYSFPSTEKETEIQEDYQSEPTKKYLVQSQNLPTYIIKNVVDGNTVVTEDGKRIRLIGIKAPDKDEEYGIEATDFLKKIVEGKPVAFQIDEKNEKDSFGRYRGIIYINRKNVNIEMLKNGLAHLYPTSPSIVGDRDWEQFSTEAKEAKRGLWSGEKSEVKIEEDKKEEEKAIF